jgi:hypothetical protein
MNPVVAREAAIKLLTTGKLGNWSPETLTT